MAKGYARLKLKTIILMVEIVLCLASVVIILVNSKAGMIQLFFLPLCFLVAGTPILSLFYDKILRNVGAIIIILQLFLRNVILPPITALGGVFLGENVISTEYLIDAIFLMSFEMLACFTVIACLKKKTKRIAFSDYELSEKLKSRYTVASLGVFLLVVFCVCMWFTSGLIRDSYADMVSLLKKGWKENYVTYVQLAEYGSVGRTIASLFAFLFKILRLVIPAYLIRKVGQKKTNFRFLISLLIILTQFLFVSSSTAEPFICSLILVFLLCETFPSKIKITVGGFGIACVLCMLLIFISGGLGTTSGLRFDFLSTWLNAYFTGVSNVAATFVLEEGRPENVLIMTVLRSFPSFIMPFSLDEGLNEVFTRQYPGQIFSTIGSGYYMFGFAFAMLPSAVLTMVSLKCGTKFLEIKETWGKVFYLNMSVMAALALGMYNVPIVLGNIVRVGIPLALIMFASKIRMSRI